MRTEPVSFYSEGLKIGAILRLPDAPLTEPAPAIAQGPGWLGLKDGKLYERYHQALTDAGFVVLVFDYRGFGDSEGDRDLIDPAMQIQDWRNAITYLQTRSDVDPNRIGAFGTGGTGGGNAVAVAGIDDRVLCTVCQVGVADGEDWLHRMRSEYEWLDFLKGLDEDRRERATTGKGRLVHPREEIMVPTQERRTTTIKGDVDDRIPSAISLAAADEILEYRPLRAAEHLTTPLLVIAVEGDATTPTDHAEQIYEAVKGPRELIMQRHTTHYAAYDQYWERVTPRIVSWFDTHLRSGGVVARSSDGSDESTTFLED